MELGNRLLLKFGEANEWSSIYFRIRCGERGRLSKNIIAISPQETAIAPNLTVHENLELMAGVHGFPKKDRKRKVTEIMHTFSLMP